MRPILFDTCAVIWLTTGAPLSAAALSVLVEADVSGKGAFVSPITAWELGLLSARGRLPVRASARALLDNFLSRPGLRYADMPPAVLIDSSFLPGTPPTDPADRIIIATARQYGLGVMTRDRRILDYADQGHVMALAC